MNGKQAFIQEGGLSISKINGLQTEISGLQTELSEFQTTASEFETSASNSITRRIVNVKKDIQLDRKTFLIQ